MAAANASAWLGAAVVPIVVGKFASVWKSAWSRPVLSALIVAFAAGSLVAAGTWDAASTTSIATSSLVGMGRVDLDLASHVMGRATESDIFVVQGTDGTDQGFKQLVGMIEASGGGFYRLNSGPNDASSPGEPSMGVVGPDDVVLIKVNAQWNQRGGTNTDLLRSIIEAVLEHPRGFRGEVVVADNGQAQFGSSGRGGSLQWSRNNAIDPAQSVADVVAALAESHRVSAHLWDSITTTRVDEFADGDMRDGYVVADAPSPSTGLIVSYPKFTTQYGTHVSFANGVWDPQSATYDTQRLTVINVPVLKSHSIYGVTAAVKHYMGVVSDKLTSHNAHRSVANGGMGTQMVETRVPGFNVIDAIWVNARPGNGPSTPYAAASETRVIAASRDPVALDVWASVNVLMAAAERLGHLRTGSMDPRLGNGSAYSRWLELSAAELQAAGIAAVTDLSRVNVRVELLRQ